jgi:cytochrome c nitrite reductase small subunit
VRGDFQTWIEGHRRLVAALFVLAGAATGVGAFTFKYAEGLSYLSDDPAACKNCHIMNDQYDSWVKGSHHKAATCADCHLPHDFIGKYTAKARNGWNHSKAFTLQNFPEPIRITRHNLDSLQHNCIECHREMVGAIAGHEDVGKNLARCTDCHRSVGHMNLD